MGELGNFAMRTDRRLDLMFASAVESSESDAEESEFAKNMDPKVAVGTSAGNLEAR